MLLVALALCVAQASTDFAADPPPITSSFYGSLTSGGQALPDGTSVSVWVGGNQLAQGTTFGADGGSAFILDVPGDIAGTPEIEGAQAGQTITFKVGGATAPETAGWQSGQFRQDLTVSAGADIAVTIDGETAVYPTSILVYTLTVENRSSAAASGVVLEGTVPEHVDTVPGCLFLVRSAFSPGSQPTGKDKAGSQPAERSSRGLQRRRGLRLPG